MLKHSILQAETLHDLTKLLDKASLDGWTTIGGIDSHLDSTGVRGRKFYTALTVKPLELHEDEKLMEIAKQLSPIFNHDLSRDTSTDTVVVKTDDET